MSGVLRVGEETDKRVTGRLSTSRQVEMYPDNPNLKRTYLFEGKGGEEGKRLSGGGVWEERCESTRSSSSGSGGHGG